MNARTSPPPNDPWDPGVRAADVPVAEGVEPGPFDDLASEFETASDIDTRTVRITFFPDETARSSLTADLTLSQLADRIAKQAAASKMELPWLKLAIFGDKRSEKNCLRTNANVVHVTGIEVEHDAGEITFDTAIAVMREARIRSLLYTSPSYRPATKERWRILLPLSQNHPPETREKLVAHINGLFGGKIAPESFVLSQAYLFGHVDNPDHRVEVVDGDFLDLRDDLYAGSIFKDGSRVGDGAGNASSNGGDQQQRHKSRSRRRSRAGRPRQDRSRARGYQQRLLLRDWLRVAGALHHALGEYGFEVFDRWSAKATAKYNADECQGGWRGARTLTEFTAGTIFYLPTRPTPAGAIRSMKYRSNLRSGERRCLRGLAPVQVLRAVPGLAVQALHRPHPPLISATPFLLRDPKLIPKRQWLYGQSSHSQVRIGDDCARRCRQVQSDDCRGAGDGDRAAAARHHAAAARPGLAVEWRRPAGGNRAAHHGCLPAFRDHAGWRSRADCSSIAVAIPRSSSRPSPATG